MLHLLPVEFGVDFEHKFWATLEIELRTTKWIISMNRKKKTKYEKRKKIFAIERYLKGKQKNRATILVNNTHWCICLYI